MARIVEEIIVIAKTALRDRTPALAVTAILVLQACDDGADVASRRKPTRPPTVAVPAAEIVVGFAKGTLRDSAPVRAFHIMKHPVNVGAFRDCVAARACAEPPAEGCHASGTAPVDGPTWGTDDDAAPLMCAGLDGARAYCRWLGGTLPTLPELLHAVRGPQTQWFPWGDKAATCREHPLGSAVEGQECDSSFAIGRHPGGASIFGVEDFRLGKGELAAAEEHSTFAACTRADGGCVVSGVLPGALDSVEALEAGQPARSPYAFRCAIEEGT